MPTNTKNKKNDYTSAWVDKINEAKGVVTKKGATITNQYPRYGTPVSVPYTVFSYWENMPAVAPVVKKPSKKAAAKAKAEKAVRDEAARLALKQMTDTIVLVKTADTATTLAQLKSLTKEQKESILNQLKATDTTIYNRAYNLLTYNEEPWDFLVKKAETIAREAYQGKFRTGSYYTLSITREEYVVGRLNPQFDKVVAWLSHVVEDNLVSLNFLKKYFPQSVTIAVEAISKRPGELYADYLKRVKYNWTAKAVKIKDIEHELQYCTSHTDLHAKLSLALEFLKAY